MNIWDIIHDFMFWGGLGYCGLYLYHYGAWELNWWRELLSGPPEEPTDRVSVDDLYPK